MENEGRILEVLSESSKRQDQMLVEMKETNERLGQTNDRLYKVEIEMSKVQEELVKLNLQTNENTRAIIKLADRLEQVVDHEKRIAKLESIVIK